MQRDTAAIRALIRQHKRWDLVFAGIGALLLAIAALTFLTLFVDMLVQGAPRLTSEFFTNFPSRRAENAGILSAWIGSTLVMLVTAVVAVPVGVAAGVYLEVYARRNWLTDLIEINITNLAGVPSIVYGLLALGLFVYQFGFGQSILSAGLTLALLILPVVIVATRESIRAIPQGIREGAYALGSTRWQMVSDHLLPYSAAGILTGVIIGLARAIGGAPLDQFRVADLAVHGDADPDVQLDLATGGRIPGECSCGRLHPRFHDPRDERYCDLAAIPSAQEHQVVTHGGNAEHRC
jgi:phosphate transport system permease protein